MFQEQLFVLAPDLIAAIRASQRSQTELGWSVGLTQSRLSVHLSGRPFGGRKTLARVVALGAAFGLTPDACVVRIDPRASQKEAVR